MAQEYKKKIEIPAGLWVKCKSCGEIIYRKNLDENYWMCPECGYHFRITAHKYLEILSDEGYSEEYDTNLRSLDPLEFKDLRTYKERYSSALKKTGMDEAVISGKCRINGIEVFLGIMDFRFMGGSMGSVVGEKIKRLLLRGAEEKKPVINVIASGGARMQEGILSLMQMAKTSAAVKELNYSKTPYINVLTHPSTAGVMASYGSLADIIIAEPKALLGFAGPRVIKNTIGSDLPPGFQLSEFFLEKGMLDNIVKRSSLKKELAKILSIITHQKKE